MSKIISKSLNKESLSKKISLKTGLPKSLSLKFVDSLFKTITSILIKNGNFKYKNFGVLKINYKEKRIGRNPKTLKQYIISARKTVTFKSSDKLKKKMNSN
jgi:nucleoid DNA-binding protein